MRDSPMQEAIVRVLQDSSVPMATPDIAEAAETSPGSANLILKRLAEKKLVRNVGTEQRGKGKSFLWEVVAKPSKLKPPVTSPLPRPLLPSPAPSPASKPVSKPAAMPVGRETSNAENATSAPNVSARAPSPAQVSRPAGAHAKLCALLAAFKLDVLNVDDVIRKVEWRDG